MLKALDYETCDSKDRKQSNRLCLAALALLYMPSRYKGNAYSKSNLQVQTLARRCTNLTQYSNMVIKAYTLDAKKSISKVLIKFQHPVLNLAWERGILSYFIFIPCLYIPLLSGCHSNRHTVLALCGKRMKTKPRWLPGDLLYCFQFNSFSVSLSYLSHPG